MSNYNLVAMSSSPDLFISSNSLTDQSGKNIYTVVNDSDLNGQPLIRGNPSSFLVGTNEIAINANPIFFKKGSYLEFVAYVTKPEDSICIFGTTDESHGIFITRDSVELRFLDGLSTTRILSIPISVPSKIHVVLTFDEDSVTFLVNGNQRQISFVKPNELSSSVKFKGTIDYEYIIDGIGVYSSKFIKKDSLIEFYDSNYMDVISRRFGTTGTLFSSPRILEHEVIRNSDFFPINYDNSIATINFTPINDINDFISIECDHQDVPITWVLDGNQGVINSRGIIVPVSLVDTLMLMIPNVFSELNFTVTVKVVESGDITTHTPANMVLNNGAFYPQEYTSEIISCPPGVRLDGGFYTGQWVVDPLPKSIEIVFKANDSSDNTIFSDSFGQASYGAGSISGYTAYLNGESVANLNAVVPNQWNHLILTSSSVIPEQFILNEDGGDISYLLMNCFTEQLSENDVQSIYGIFTAQNKIRLIESSSNIDETLMDGNSSFSIYTYAWAIVSGGGVG